MNALSRRLAIGAAGAAAAALAWFAPSGSEDLYLPRSSPSSAQDSASRPAAASALAMLPQRAGIGAPAGEPFRTRSWLPPVPKAAAAPVAAPVAPPNPYKYAGRVVQDGAARIFLSRNERVHEAVVGEALDDGYRVESISAEQIVLVYLPLGTRDLLPIDARLNMDPPVAADAPPPSRTRKWRQDRAAAFRPEVQ